MSETYEIWNTQKSMNVWWYSTGSSTIKVFFLNDQGIFFLKSEPESNQDFTLNYHFTGNKGKGGAS